MSEIAGVIEALHVQRAGYPCRTGPHRSIVESVKGAAPAAAAAAAAAGAAAAAAAAAVATYNDHCNYYQDAQGNLVQGSGFMQQPRKSYRISG